MAHNIYCHRLSIYSFSTSFLSRLLFLSIDKARINAEEKNDKAIKVSEWMVSNMQKKNGSFKFLGGNPTDITKWERQ